MLSPRSIKVSWDGSLSSTEVTGYLISYTTNALYTSGGSVTVNDGDTTSHTLTNLEEYTTYTITIQVTTNSIMGPKSDELSVITLTDGK